jgi:hypothetical protein
VLVASGEKYSKAWDASEKTEEVATWLFGHSVPVLKEYDQSGARDLFGGE